jgi:hypothetical protein
VEAGVVPIGVAVCGAGVDVGVAEIDCLTGGADVTIAIAVTVPTTEEGIGTIDSSGVGETSAATDVFVAVAILVSVARAVGVDPTLVALAETSGVGDATLLSGVNVAKFWSGRGAGRPREATTTLVMPRQYSEETARNAARSIARLAVGCDQNARSQSTTNFKL